MIDDPLMMKPFDEMPDEREYKAYDFVRQSARSILLRQYY